MIETALSSAGERSLEFWLLLSVGTAAAVIAWFKLDDRRENVRRKAAQLAKTFHELGLDRLSQACEDISIGDVSGATNQLRGVIAAAQEIGDARAIAMAVVEKMAPELRDDPTHGARFRALASGDSPAAATAPPAVPPPAPPQRTTRFASR
ncbi:MAG: hypothetical protein AAF805_02115 [Planctomycetota bacterium]